MRTRLDGIFSEFLQPGRGVGRIVDNLANHSTPKIIVAFARIAEFETRRNSESNDFFNDFGFDHQKSVHYLLR
jgi:hypothetical protein